MKKAIKLKKLKVFAILERKPYLLLMAFSSLLIMVSLPLIQSRITGSFRNIDIWFKIIPKFNLLLFVIFSISFGLMLALQVYSLRMKTCDIRKRATATSSSGIGAFIALLVPACPACISLVTLILPASLALSFTQFILEFNSWLLMLSIALIAFGIFMLGGFRKTD